jgi:hypothetical protein
VFTAARVANTLVKPLFALNADYRMVSEKAGAAALVANFADKGLGVQQLVALSGAHTIGEAQLKPGFSCLLCVNTAIE